eukprot:6206666-Pleurochrysis_carterae.AAC.1
MPPAAASRGSRGGRGGRGGRGSRGGRGRSAFVARAGAPSAREAAEHDDAAAADSTQVQHVPTAAELSADADELCAIRDMFGS